MAKHKKKAVKRRPKAPKPGELVLAQIGEDERGPFYYVQKAGQIATIQGKETHEVHVDRLKCYAKPD